MPDALSVDALCGFGAKNFNGCTEFIQLGRWMNVEAQVSGGHIARFVRAPGSVLVRMSHKCHIPGRGGILAATLFAVKVAPIAGMLPSSRLVHCFQSRALSCKQVISPGVRAVFALDSRLQQDTLTIGDFPLCRLLLSNDANYPWFILVPRRDDISELFQLDVADQQRLWQETTALAEVLKDSFDADKINVATLGNVVSQLHMHVIVRKRDDAAWPAPVWGKHPAKPYSAEQVAAIRERLRLVLDEDFTFLEG